jgi:hypothetical protein
MAAGTDVNLMGCKSPDPNRPFGDLVSCPGDFVSTDAAPGVSISPAKGSGGFGVGADVFSQFAGQIGDRGKNAPAMTSRWIFANHNSTWFNQDE